MKFHALFVLGALLLGSVVAQSSDTPPEPPVPIETETAPEPAEPLPTPFPDALPEPAPVPVPAPVPTPVPTPSPLPSPAVSPTRVAAPLSVVFTETVPTALNGQKIYEVRSETLSLSPERSKLLRSGGKVTPSLRQDLEHFTKRLERNAHDARFEHAPISGEWRLVMRSGVKVDLEATLAALAEALRDPLKGRVNVVYSTSRPARTLDFFLTKGITGLLGEGVTSYAGSSAARTTNIHIGARRFQEVLLDGSLFSFNQMVGPVSAAGGYLPGLVIAGERTASGVGGGICQVSTTIFRALYAAGLPVRERQNHSYQVRYYDPQGLDATIYQPNLDLKFDNDTGAPLWFQAAWDDRSGSLRMQVFGRPRAESVEIGTPRVLATQAAPPERLITDASLAPGRRVQIDWAAPGATIEVQRIFRRGGEVVRSDILRSVYRPWPNIYLVGPPSGGTAQR